jgi:hypothetical protein
MTGQRNFDFEGVGAEADLLERIMNRCDRVLVKKLSNNDRDWAKFGNKHQAGVYIPPRLRDGGFFPTLHEKARDDPSAAPIWESMFLTRWPQVGGEERCSRIAHYTSKGQETHMTRLPKAPFAELLPASFLVMGRLSQGEQHVYECLTIESGSAEAALLAELFDLGPDFLINDFVPAEQRSRERERVLDFAEQVIAAWLAGTIDGFARENATMPSTAELARMAREVFLAKHRIEVLDPFVMDRPGDALREISRAIEWDLFREFQRRERSVALVRIVLGDLPCSITASEVIRRLVDELPKVDALMLSAGQQRKARAGYSYEHHIEAMLRDGGIPFEKQVVIEGRRRPDFILPSLAFIDRGDASAKTGLILSAKTTLRERWKQVEREMGGRRLFLTTVDENVAGNVIEGMAEIGVQLVVPESLMKAKETEYAGHSNVLSFGQFCAEVIRPVMPAWDLS